MFPDELKQYKQWICWKYGLTADGKPTKLPYNPQTGQLASVADPSSWTDYDKACLIFSESNSFYSGLGFVFTETDPLFGLDLDDPYKDATIQEASDRIARYNLIIQSMPTYSEYSPSGKGLHLIGKGVLPGAGRRRDGIEVYSSRRYFTMTGNTFQNYPIADCNYIVNELYKELQDDSDYQEIDLSLLDQPEQFTDRQVYDMALQAKNGNKFEQLWNGNYDAYYRSQSEADFGMLDMLGFYSRNVKQIYRMFLLTGLGQREKAKKRFSNYILPMIKRSFDNMPPALPIEQLKANLERQFIAEQQQKIVESKPIELAVDPFAGPLFANVPSAEYDWTKPPGLLGEIMNFIYQQSPRPVKEIALAAAIGMMAGICGRAYNISGEGVNQYVLILAGTGTGKEAAKKGIEKLVNELTKISEAVDGFIGAGGIASGQALIKQLARTPCFVSIVGEFGLILQQMCAYNANPSQVHLRSVLLDLYHKSGFGNALRPIIYSDKDKNTPTIPHPAFSLLGESTPSTFYQSLDENMIAQGLLPRFTIIEYAGQVPPLNKAHKTVQPDRELIKNLIIVASNCLTVAHNNQVIEVKLDAEADVISDEVERMARDKQNSSDSEISKHLWNRAHIKTLKLAALIAIGINPYVPVVDAGAIIWARNLIERDVNNVLEQFKTGKAGKETSELNQINELVRMIRDFVRRPYAGLQGYNVDLQMHKDHIFGIDYLQRRCLSKGAFKSDRMGARFALKRSIESLVEDGAIAEVKGHELYTRYGKQGKAFCVKDLTRF